MSAIPQPPRSLLDTDIFSEFLRGQNPRIAARAAQYQTAHGRFTISAITLMEVCSGWQCRGQQTRIDTLLQLVRSWEILPVTGEIAALAGRMDGDLIRTGQVIGLADVLITASALHLGLVLVTGNTAHHQRLQALSYPVLIDDWRQ